MEIALKPEEFGALLRQHRLAAGLMQEALAERAGLGVRSIQGLERGVALWSGSSSSASWESSLRCSPPAARTVSRTWR